MTDTDAWLIAMGILAVYALCVYISCKTGTDIEVQFWDR